MEELRTLPQTPGSSASVRVPEFTLAQIEKHAERKFYSWDYLWEHLRVCRCCYEVLARGVTRDRILVIPRVFRHTAEQLGQLPNDFSEVHDHGGRCHDCQRLEGALFHQLMASIYGDREAVA